jgi:hypothetical protein
MREQNRRLQNQSVCPNYSTTYTPELCQMIGSVLFLERFLERMKEKLPPRKLKLRINVGRPDSFLECEREYIEYRPIFEKKVRVWLFGAWWIRSYGNVLMSQGIDDSKMHFTRGEARNFYDIVWHLSIQVGNLEDRMKVEEKEIRLIVDHPKSVFDCKIGDERFVTPVFTSDNGNKIISYPGPHVKIANKRTM